MKKKPISQSSLVKALVTAKKASNGQILEHSKIERKDLNLLSNAGWLSPIVRGWYLLSRPEEQGSTVAWYSQYWSFLAIYLEKRFGKNGYCFSAEASLDFLMEESHVPSQIVVITKRHSNQKILLPHDTSILLYSDLRNFPLQTIKKKGISMMSLPLALAKLSLAYFKHRPINVELALKFLSSVSELSRVLLEKRMTTAAERLVGAFRALKDFKSAQHIMEDFKSIGISLEPVNPFKKHEPVLGNYKRIISPYAGRIDAKWDLMRKEILKKFPRPSEKLFDVQDDTIKTIRDLYNQDAYNSLSIEGYEVTEELIQKIALGGWNPDLNAHDKKSYDALAAKGYHEAFQKVLLSVQEVLKGKNSGQIFETDLQAWYRALFSPLAKANLIQPSDLAGYRNQSVYIRGSRHVPPSYEAVPDTMEVLFRRLKDEPEASVRAILGHFIFVYVHPYRDGNGRLGRFLMNLMLISGGYSWTVIRNSERARYMSALESASSEEDIVPFVDFIRSEMEYWNTHKK